MAKTAARRRPAFQIRGVSHNIPFLSALMRHPRFISGRLTTGFIAEEFPDGFHGVEASGEDQQLLAAVAAVAHHMTALRDAQVSGRISPPKLNSGADYVVVMGQEQLPVTVAETATDHVGIHGGFCLWKVVKGQFTLVEPLNPEGLVIIPAQTP